MFIFKKLLIFVFIAISFSALGARISDNSLYVGKSSSDNFFMYHRDGGYIKKTAGATWAFSSDGVGEALIGKDPTLVTKTASATLLNVGEEIVAADSSTGNLVFNLPDATTNANIFYSITKISASNTVTIDASGSQTIDGFLTLVLRAKDDSAMFFSNGSNWIITNKSMAPTKQSFTSGSGTYTTPDHVRYLRVRMVGGGGGGQGGSSLGGATTTAGNGGNTTFGSSLLAANGGTGGIYTVGGSGGTVTVNPPAIDFGSIGGTPGNTGARDVVYPVPGIGGASFLGGSGRVSLAGAGSNATTNSGSGGGGGAGINDATSGTVSGSGGGSGGYVDAIILNPSSSYSYTIGAAGTASSPLGSGMNGGDGGEGFIIVEENY